jgi:Family of unknown function (DUF6502)
VPGKTRQEKTAISARRASSILFPIATFLHAGGMSPETALAIFGASMKRVSKLSVGRKLEHIGHPTRYTDIVGMWMRSKRFIDKNGRPRMLRIEGRDGFNSLVRSVAWQADPKAVLAVLIRYGNVRRTKKGTYELMRPFFYTSNSESMAFEPIVNFLSDVTSNLSKILKRSASWKGPELFWTKTENAQISEVVAKRFTAYARERGLVFLDELDDWLEANADRKKAGRKPRRRVGLGIFSIYSDRELLDVRA